MKVSTDDFRRTYEGLSDDALLAMNSEELVEVARQCYGEELARRGLTLEQPEAEPATPEGEDLVEVARFENIDELDLARALLKSAEIRSFLSSDLSLPGVFRATGSTWHELYVKSADVDVALEILESEISEEELAAQAEAAAAVDAVEEEE